MADGDKITIDQINWDDSNLPKWATASTQEKVKKILEKSLKEQEDQTKNDEKQLRSLKSITDNIKKQFEASSRSSKSMIEALEKQSDENQASTKLISSNQVKQISVLNSISNLIQQQIDQIPVLSGNITDAIDRIKSPNTQNAQQGIDNELLEKIASAVSSSTANEPGETDNNLLAKISTAVSSSSNQSGEKADDNDSKEQIGILETIQKTISDQENKSPVGDIDKDTINDLSSAIQKLVDALNKKSSNSKNDGGQEKIMAMMTAVKADPRALNLAKKSLKEQKEQTDEATSATDAIDKILETNNKGFADLYKKYSQQAGLQAEKMAKANIKTPFAAVNKKIAGFAKSLGFGGLALGAFATSIGFIVGRLKQFSDSFRQLFASGFRFEQGSMGLAKAAVAAEMGIAEYTEILGKYSTSVGILGTQAFSDLNLAMRDNLQSQGMLGMSLAELTEYTADYVDQLRTTGILSGQNNEDLEEMAANYMKNITAFTQLANVNRDQINAVVKSATSIDAFTNKLNTLPDTVQRTVLAATQAVAGMFAGIGSEFGDQLATTFTTAYGRGGLFFTEAGRELLAVNKRLYNSLDGVINNMENMSDEEAAKATANLIDEIANTTDAERERLAVIERSNTEYAGAAREQIAFINKIQQLEEEGKIEIYKDLQKLREESRVDKLSVSFINFERVVAKFKTVFNTFFTRLFGDDKVYNAINGIMTMLSENAIKIADFVRDFAGKIGDIFAKVINFMMDMFTGAYEGGKSIFASVFGPLKQILSEGIAAGINRGIAATVIGGTSAEDLDNYDKLLDAINSGNKTESERDALLKQLASDAGVNTYQFSQAMKNDDPAKQDAARANLEEKIAEEIGKFYGGSVFKTAATVTNQPENQKDDAEKAVEERALDPKSLTDAKMEISKQYLPMSGSSDPSDTAEGEYYATSLALLTRIANASDTSAKSNKSTADSING